MEKTMTIYCRKCGQPERALNLHTGERHNVKHGDNVKSILCSNCIQLAYLEKDRKKKEAAA